MTMPKKNEKYVVRHVLEKLLTYSITLINCICSLYILLI